MADENTASVRIVGDASQVAPAVAVAKDEVGSIGPALAQLSAQFAEMAMAMREGFAQVTTALAGTKEEIKAVEAETKKEVFFLRELGAAMKETVLGVHEGVESFNKFRRGLSELMEVYLAFTGVEMFGEMAEKMGEAAEQTQHLAQRFGMTTAQMQALNGVAISSGVSFDTLTHGMMLLDRTAATTPEKFKKLGIEVKAGASQMEILVAVADRFKEMPDGPTKTAAAMQTMGRNGAAMLPILNQGAEGLQELIEKSKEYGLVNDDAQRSGMALAESVNEGKLAWAGLKETLSGAFAPLLTEMIDGFNGLVKAMTASYESGGAIKVIFEGIVAVAEGFGEVFHSVGSAVEQVFGSMGGSAKDWSDFIQFCVDTVVGVIKVCLTVFVVAATGIKVAFDMIKAVVLDWYATLKEDFGYVGIAIDALQSAFQTFAQVAVDALTLNWGQINADWQAGVNRLVNTVKVGAAQLKSDVAAIRADSAAAMGNATNAAGKDFDAWYAKFNAPHTAPKKTGIEGGGGGGTGDLPDLAKHKKEKKPKEKKEKDELVQRLDEELTAKKTAWAMEQDAKGTAIAFSLRAEEEFWVEAKARTDLSAKDRIAIEGKWLAVRRQLLAQAWAIEEAGYKTQLDAAGKDAAAKSALVVKHTAEVLRMFGAESSQYAAAKEAEAKAAKAAQDQIEAIETAHAGATAKREEDGIAQAKVMAEHRVAMGRETVAQLLAQERQFEDEKFAIEVAQIQREWNLAKDDPVKQAKLYDDMLAVKQKHADAETAIDQKAEVERSKIRLTALQGTETAFSQSLSKMLTMQQGFLGSFQSFYKSMVGVLDNVLSSLIQKQVAAWIAGEGRKTAAVVVGTSVRNATEAAGAATSVGISAISAIKQVAHHAAVAAAGAYAAIASIPVIGPILAPIAAAVALAGVYELGKTVFSAEGGMGEVPADGTLIIGHAKEMMLPANLATPLRSMLASNNNAPTPANDSGGGFHYHDHTERGLTPSQIEANHAAVGRAVLKAQRAGVFSGTRLSF